LYVASNFKGLVAYRLSVALAADIYAVVGRWPAFDRSTVGEQLVRSADAVPANIAESTGKRTIADRRRTLTIARSELYETEHWLSVAHARGLIRSTDSERVAEIARTLNGLIRRPVPS
jgi:four helix bundle protein